MQRRKVGRGLRPALHLIISLPEWLQILVVTKPDQFVQWPPRRERYHMIHFPLSIPRPVHPCSETSRHVFPQFIMWAPDRQRRAGTPFEHLSRSALNRPEHAIGWVCSTLETFSCHGLVSIALNALTVTHIPLCQMPELTWTPGPETRKTARGGLFSGY